MLGKFIVFEGIDSCGKTYLQLPKLLPKHNIKIIDASKSIPEVWEQTRRELDRQG